MRKTFTIEVVDNGFIVDFFTTEKGEEVKRWVAKDTWEIYKILEKEVKISIPQKGGEKDDKKDK